jgi:hypothetical protein
MARRSGAVDAPAPTAAANVARVSLATSGTDFTEPRGEFRSDHPGCWLLSREITFVTWELQELGQRVA